MASYCTSLIISTSEPSKEFLMKQGDIFTNYLESLPVSIFEVNEVKSMLVFD